MGISVESIILSFSIYGTLIGHQSHNAINKPDSSTSFVNGLIGQDHSYKSGIKQLIVLFCSKKSILVLQSIQN